MDAGHWIRKKGGGWLIGVPPEVRRSLGVTHRTRLYWILTRRGEVVLAENRKRSTGRQPTRLIARELAAARKEIDAIHQRDARRDRQLYAEGFAHGYMQSYERLVTPTGPSAERGYRRSLYRWAFRDAAQETDPKQVAPRPAPSPERPNSRGRRARRDRHADEARARRAVEVVETPVLVLPDGVKAFDAPEPD